MFPSLAPHTRLLSRLISHPDIIGLGDSSILVRFGTGIEVSANEAALQLLNSLESVAPVGLVDLVPGYASLLIHFDPIKTNSQSVIMNCREALVRATNSERQERVVQIPVRYNTEDGPDLDDVANLSGLTRAQVIQAHTTPLYRVYFIGFMAGFPYLGGLSKQLTSVPRLATPRTNVKGGSVALAAGQTGVYTVDSPGGWRVIGHTNAPLFNPTCNPPALLRAGDRVQFIDADAPKREHPSISTAGSAFQSTSEQIPTFPAHVPWICVEQPGLLTTVQDLGRKAYGRHGVSASGAADELALRMGNALVGNTDAANAAVLEVTVGGLRVKFLHPCVIAITGADCGPTLDKACLAMRTAVLVKSGSVLELGTATRGLRAYVSVGGGIGVHPVLGSRSTDVRAGVGPLARALQAGDTLSRLTHPLPIPASLMRYVLDPFPISDPRKAEQTWELRVLPGPGDPNLAGSEQQQQELIGRQTMALLKGLFVVDPRSDRMGVRLRWVGDAAGEGRVGSCLESKSPLQGGQVLSEGVVRGTVQLPPDGDPVILLADHQTTGGYRVPGVVISADQWRVAQLKPGDTVRFVTCDATAADHAWRSLRQSVSALKPALAGPTFDLGKLRLGYSSGVGLVKRDKLAIRASTGPPLRVVDLNADAGEGFDDAGLFNYVTSANIACGGHVGSASELAPVIAEAVRRQVVIGAQVSYEDKAGFGRRTLDTPPDVLRAQVLWQASALDGLCRGFGTRVQYLKPHGALYHTVLSGGPQADAVIDAAKILNLPLLLMPLTKWGSISEGFAERTYDGDKLRPRSLPNALIEDPHEAAAQALRLAEKGIQSICIHGDSHGAVLIAKTVRQHLESSGWTIRSFFSPALQLQPGDSNIEDQYTD